jgi:hypothetical protein
MTRTALAGFRGTLTSKPPAKYSAQFRNRGAHESINRRIPQRRKIVKKTLPLFCLVAVFGLTLAAQTQPGTPVFHTTEKSSVYLPAPEVPAGLKTIYSNLGSGDDRYNYETGWTIIGPTWEGDGISGFFAIAFTPESNAHVTEALAAILYGGSGDNQVNLSIYSDSDGVPGTLLAGPVTVANLAPTGTCCELAVANFPPLAVSAGTQYWLVANTPTTGTGSNFYGTWAASPKVLQQAINSGSGWEVFDCYVDAAGAVLGTVP